MKHMRAGLFVLLVSSGCTVSVDHSQNTYLCEVSPQCPPGFECMAGTCVDPLANPSSPDADNNNPPVIDASLADADVVPMPDAALPSPDAGIEPLVRSIAASADDAEESLVAGTVTLASSDLELIQATDGQLVGLRFVDVQLDQGQVLENVRLRFTTDEVSTGAASLDIRAEAADEAAVFTTATSDLSLRPTTTAVVNWVPPDWPTVDESTINQVTPNLAPVLQEIVNRPGWQPGSSVVFLISGTGKRVAFSFDGDPAKAPRLIVF